MGRSAYLSKPQEWRRKPGIGIAVPYHPSRSPVTAEQQALYLNAIPLLVLGAVYLVAASSLLPEVLRARGVLRELELALALVFPCVGVAAVLIGLLILREGEPIGGSAWPALGAIALSLLSRSTRAVLARLARDPSADPLLAACSRALLEQGGPAAIDTAGEEM